MTKFMPTQGLVTCKGNILDDDFKVKQPNIAKPLLDGRYVESGDRIYDTHMQRTSKRFTFRTGMRNAIQVLNAADELRTQANFMKVELLGNLAWR